MTNIILIAFFILIYLLYLSAIALIYIIVSVDNIFE